MKVGDLVRYDSTNDLFQWDGEIGIIVEAGPKKPAKRYFPSYVMVSWSCKERGTWISEEREENLEVVNEDRRSS